MPPLILTSQLDRGVSVTGTAIAPRDGRQMRGDKGTVGRAGWQGDWIGSWSIRSWRALLLQLLLLILSDISFRSHQ